MRAHPLLYAFLWVATHLCGNPLSDCFAHKTANALFTVSNGNTISGPIIALYDQDNNAFCGTLLWNKNKGEYLLSTRNALGFFTSKILSNEALDAYCEANAAIIGCPLQEKKHSQKERGWGLSALGLAGLLITLHGARSFYNAEPASKTALAEDFLHSLALVLMYFGVDAIAGNAGGVLYLASVSTTYSYHASDHSFLPLIAGPLFCFAALKRLKKFFGTQNYRSPRAVLKYAQQELEKRLG